MEREQRIENLRSRIASNRDKIDRALSTDMPLDTLYALVRIWKDENESMIQEVKKLKDGQKQ